MPKVTYVEHDGTRHEVDVSVGTSIMRGAVDNGIPGIDADCGGQAACATCHVLVDPGWMDKVGPATDEHEKAMLESGGYMHDNSRLSCQIKATDDLDGLIIQLPESQF